MTDNLPYPVIFDKIVEYMNFEFSVCSMASVRPYLFDEDENFRQLYGKDGLKKLVPELNSYSLLAIFKDELDPLIRLTGSVCNYLANYIYCIELEPDQDYTDVKQWILDDLKQVSPDFHIKVVSLFESEIEQLRLRNKVERDNLDNIETEFDENSWIGSIVIDAIMSLHKQETGEEISRENAIKLMKKKK